MHKKAVQDSVPVCSTCELKWCKGGSVCQVFSFREVPGTWPRGNDAPNYCRSILAEKNGKIIGIEIDHNDKESVSKLEVYNTRTVAGQGVRAFGSPGRVVFRKGDEVGAYSGILQNGALVPRNSKYLWNVVTDNAELDIVVNAERYGNFCRYLNWSREDANANVEAFNSQELYTFKGLGFKFSVPLIYAKRDIYHGEALLIVRSFCF